MSYDYKVVNYRIIIFFSEACCPGDPANVMSQQFDKVSAGKFLLKLD